MNPDRWSIVPTALGLLLLAAGAADGRELVMWDWDDDRWLFARAELELLGGLWLLCGIAPRWARISAAIAFLGISIYDLSRAVASYPPRDGFGRVAVGTAWILVGDLVVVSTLRQWRPAADSAPRIGSHPALVNGAAAIAIGIGVAIDWSQVGRFPIVATAQSGALRLRPASTTWSTCLRVIVAPLIDGPSSFISTAPARWAATRAG